MRGLGTTGIGGGDVEAAEEQKASRVKLFRSIKVKGNGCGQIIVHNDVKHPNLAWQSGRSAHLQFPVMLYVLNDGEVSLVDLIDENEGYGWAEDHDHRYHLQYIVPSSFPTPPLRTVVVAHLPYHPGPSINRPRNLGARIDVWQCLDGQVVHRVDTGGVGVFRNADGTMEPCEFTIPVSALLPPLEH
ncbi:hypothetical protein LTR15_004081 [Elasticomyces elasticus]|nr:hypothetical protein LTR15_004081 [Elasticomyces elasticus]